MERELRIRFLDISVDSPLSLLLLLLLNQKQQYKLFLEPNPPQHQLPHLPPPSSFDRYKNPK